MRHARAAAIAVCVAAAITVGGATLAHAEADHQHQDAAGHSAAATATPTPSPVDHSRPMPGMDHGIPAVSATTGPASTTESPMAAAGPTEDPAHSEASGEGEHEATHAEEEPEVPRPRGLVIGGFAALNGAVVVSAGFLRRRDRLEDQQRPIRRPRPTP